MPAAERLRRLLPSLWAGVLLCIAAIATPSGFALLARADAGRLAGRILAQEAWLSLVLAAAVLLLERARTSRAVDAGRGSAMSTELLLALGAVFCTVAGYFALQPMMVGARAGHGPLSFGQLHAISSGFYVLKLLLVLALAWRVAGSGAADRQSVSRPPFS